MKDFKNYTRPSIGLIKKISSMTAVFMMALMVGLFGDQTMAATLAAPVVDPITPSATSVKGKAANGASVIVTFANGASVTATSSASTDGSTSPFSAAVPADLVLASGDSVKVIARNASGDSPATYVTVSAAGTPAVETTPTQPATPTATPATEPAAPNTGANFELKNPLVIFGVGAVSAGLIFIIARSKK